MVQNKMAANDFNCQTLALILCANSSAFLADFGNEITNDFLSLSHLCLSLSLSTLSRSISLFVFLAISLQYIVGYIPHFSRDVILFLASLIHSVSHSFCIPFPSMSQHSRPPLRVINCSSNLPPRHLKGLFYVTCWHRSCHLPLATQPRSPSSN